MEPRPQHLKPTTVVILFALLSLALIYLTLLCIRMNSKLEIVSIKAESYFPPILDLLGPANETFTCMLGDRKYSVYVYEPQSDLNSLRSETAFVVDQWGVVFVSFDYETHDGSAFLDILRGNKVKR